MGNKTRRGILAASVAAATAAALVVGGSAAYADDESPVINPDTAVITPTPTGPYLYRFADTDRVLTSIKAARSTNLPWSDTVILASAADAHYADALAAAPLADAIDAPVLLTEPGSSVNPNVLAYLASAGVTNVILASGTQVLTSGVVNELELAGYTTERFAGVNRYATAIALAGAAIDRGGEDGWYEGNIFVADGTNFPDALAAGAAASEYNGVVLLSQGGQLEAFTAAALALTAPYHGVNAFNHDEIIAVGGAAKTAVAVGYLGNHFDDSSTTSVVGSDRYETAVLLATKYFGKQNPGADYFAVASGEISSDAVVASAWAANADGPLLLTNNSGLNSKTAAYLAASADSDDSVVVFGGQGSVSPAASEQLKDLVLSLR